MEGIFEDARNFDIRYTQKYPFYILMNGSDYEDQYPVPAHWHYYIEILYITEGTGDIVLNGQSYRIKENDVVFAMPRDVHAITLLPNTPFNYIVLKFDPDMLFEKPEKSFMLKNILPILDPIAPQFKILNNERHTTTLRHELEDTLVLFSDEPYAFELLAKANILKLFYDYITFLSDNGIKVFEEKRQYKELSHILPAYEFIHSHFKENISAKDVAEHCHLSYSYFSRVFKRLSGISFTKYLNFMRITEAEKLLLHSDASVTKVSYDVGFSDTSYFIKQFRAFKQMTPSEYVHNKAKIILPTENYK